MGMLDPPIRVGLVHPLRTWLQALAVVLAPLTDLEVVVSHAEPHWVRHAVARGEVDVVVMRLADGAGTEEVHEMRQARPEVGVVVIGAAHDSQFIPEAVRAGARGYLAEDCSVEELHTAIKLVAHGDTWLSPTHLTLLVEGLLSTETASDPGDDRLASLSEREREILDCLAQGMRRDEIADRLYISPNTVRTHINHLIKKLNVHSALAAVSIIMGALEPLPPVLNGQRVPEQRRSQDEGPVTRRPED